MRIEECFHAQAMKTPYRTALVQGSERWNYLQLDEAVRHRREELLQSGAKAGDVFCLIMPNSVEWIRDALAVLGVGGIHMPLHPDLTDEERARLMQAAPPDWLITPALQRCQHEAKSPRMLPLKRAGAVSELFFLGMTSGSTGAPKAFVKSHRSWTSGFQEWSRAFGLSSEDRILVPLHLSYSAQLYPAIHGLCIGAEVYLLPFFSASAFFQAAATCVSITPACIHPLVSFAGRHRAEQIARNFPKTVISVGTKLSGSLRQRFEASFPASSLYEYYGSSELGYVTLLAPRDAREAPETIGTPFPGVEVSFFDEKGQPVPPGKPGKLFVRSPQTFEGFIDQEQNAVSFQGEWVTSHDIGFVRREDGRIMLLGRDRDVIKAGGSLVYALEVETVLMSIEGVKEAAVIPGPDPVRGEAVWAAVSLEKGAVLANVQKALRRRLSPSKRPRKWRVFAELPKNRNGKIDKPRIALSMLSDS